MRYFKFPFPREPLRAAGAAESQEGCWPPSHGTGHIPTAFGLRSCYSWPRERGKLPTGSSAPGGVCKDRRKADENVRKMMKLGGLSSRRRCLENHFCALFWSRAKQKTCQQASWLQGDHSLLSIRETCGCTILSFKESLRSHKEHQKAPAAVSLAEDNSAQSNNLEIIFACLKAASLL